MTEEVFARQRYEAFVVVGFVVDESQLRCIAGELTEDEPPTGAVGRYHRVPVYVIGRSALPDDLPVGEWRGIRYYFIKMLVVD